MRHETYVCVQAGFRDSPFAERPGALHWQPSLPTGAYGRFTDLRSKRYEHIER